MADEQQLALLLKDVTEWNEWKASNPGIVADLSRANLGDADLTGADLIHADLSRADLTGAKLIGANLAGANLTRANLTSANLPRANLNRATLTSANLSGANLTEARLNAAGLQGAKLALADLARAQLVGADLSYADLTRANLSGAMLFNADLIEARLAHSTLTDANLSGVKLKGADLSYANLLNANLSGAHLVFVSLRGANLTGANLSHATLRGVVLDETLLVNMNLSGTHGLDCCDHHGPSTVDHRTLLQSGASLPLEFLRGCGLPDRLIDYLPSLLEAGPIQFYSCFISYSTANQDFADRLYADLQNKGVRCWFAPHDMLGGKRIHDQIDEAIRVYDRLLLILSPESMSSTWVSTEISKARQKEIAARRSVLFPVALVPFESIRDWKQFDADIGDDSAKKIREYFVPDFSDWKNHDAYQRSFDRLVKALKSQE